MSKYYVTNENSEDTFCVTDNLQEAIRIAKDVVKTGSVGDLVLIESSDGMAVKQFVLTPEGTILQHDVEGENVIGKPLRMVR